MSLTEGVCSWFLNREDLAGELQQPVVAPGSNVASTSAAPPEQQQHSPAAAATDDTAAFTSAASWHRIDMPFADGVVSVPAALERRPSARAVCVQLSPVPLRLGDLYEAAVAPNCGAVSSFVGTTRDVFDGKLVARLEYEVYGTMALSTIAQIAFRSMVSWPDARRVVVAHRAGEVGICKASVVIHVASVHRRGGLSACAYVIDTLKADVPIWKREFYRRERSSVGDAVEDGCGDAPAPPECSAWKSNSECCHGTRGSHGQLPPLTRPV